MTTKQAEAALRALLREKIHVRPGALARLPTTEAAAFASPLALGRLLLKPLADCPASLLAFWAAHPRGHAVVDWQPDAYRPGPQAVGQQTLDGVAWVSPRTLLDEPRLAAPLAYLLDHLLGCDGEPEGLWLSDGGGSGPWAPVGQRIRRQFLLGYGPGEAAVDPHAYLAWGIRGFLADRPALNVADPGLERLLATTLFDPAFWRRAGQSG